MFRRRWIFAGALLIAAGVLLTNNLACSVFGIRNWEEYPHEVVVKDGRFEIRAYEPCIVATTRMPGDMSEVSGAMFKRLGGYIFGDNTAEDEIAMTMPVIREEAEPRSEKIAMTMPVTRSPTDGGWSMSFVMPSKYSMDSLPRPDNESVDIEKRPGVLRAAYRYSGIQHASDLAEYEPRLTEWAREQGYRVKSDAMLAAYDPPWTIWFLRRNEVLVEVEPAHAPSSK